MTPPSPQDVLDGIRVFMRSQAAEIPTAHLEWVANTDDLLDAMSVIAQMFQSTASFDRVQMHQVSQYDYIEDIKNEMEEFLLVGDDVKETVQKRRKNLTMYHVVIEPIIDSFGTMGHATAVDRVERIIDHYINWIKSFEDFGDGTDGAVAQYQIKDMVTQREAARKAYKIKQKQLSRKRNTSKDKNLITIE